MTAAADRLGGATSLLRPGGRAPDSRGSAGTRVSPTVTIAARRETSCATSPMIGLPVSWPTASTSPPMESSVARTAVDVAVHPADEQGLRVTRAGTPRW